MPGRDEAVIRPNAPERGGRSLEFRPCQGVGGSLASGASSSASTPGHILPFLIHWEMMDIDGREFHMTRKYLRRTPRTDTLQAGHREAPRCGFAPIDRRWGGSAL